MAIDRKKLKLLRKADSSDDVAFVRHLCEQVLQGDPDHDPTLIRYAAALIAFAQYDDAAKVLDHADKVLPDKRRHLVHAQRGHLLKRQGDFKGAEEHYHHAHKLDPDDATYLIYAGTVAFRRGEITLAESYARKATECSEGCIDEALFNLGGYLLAQKRYHEAGDCYLKTLEIDPDYRIAKTRLADLDQILKDIDRDSAEEQ